MFRSSRLLAVPAVLVAGCSLGLTPPAAQDPSSPGPWAPADPAEVLPAVPVDPQWLDSVDGLGANDLLAEVGDAMEVPADLLAAMGLAESGFVPSAQWLLTDGERIDRAAAVSGLSAARIGEDRAANVAAAAALLSSLATSLGERGHEAEADAPWWSAVAASSFTDEPWIDARHAAEVFADLQAGGIAEAVPAAAADGPDILVLPPREVPGLAFLQPEDSPADFTLTTDYPGAVEGLRARGGAARAEIRRIVLRATETSFARALDRGLREGTAHYLVRRADGSVTQLLPEAEAAAGVPDDSVVIEVAARSDRWNAWTPQVIEGSARLAGWLSWSHGFPLDSARVEIEVGDEFPAQPWREMARCFAEGGGESCAMGLAGSPEGPIPPPELEGGGEARDGSSTTGSAGPIPYFYQYANTYNPGGSCQNTSVAMVLRHYGWNGSPDQISHRFGTSYAQSPANLAQMFNTLAQEAGLSVRLTARTSGSIAGLRALLASGKPTIIHGYFTGYGHVLVALGYDGSHYTVNDPAGRWAQAWKGGYPFGWNANIGKGIRYGRAAFEQAVATSDGSTPLPLWYHEITGVPATPSAPTPPEAPAGGPSGGADPGDSAGGGGSDDDESPYAWASVEWIEPRDGFVAGDPLLLRARRVSGQRVEFWAGPYRLAESLENPASTAVDFHTHGERSLTARNVSQWGTLLASRTIRGTVLDTGAITPMTTNLGSNEWLITASTDVSGVAYVRYDVDGFLLEDTETGQRDALGPDYALRYAFTAEEDDRVLVARAYDAHGDVVAVGQRLLDVDGSPPAECDVAGFIGCGERVSGDTLARGSDLLNGYPQFVGNYSGPEIGYRFSVPGGGPIEFRFIDPVPTVLDQDIFVLRSQVGQCTAPDVVARGFNTLVWEAATGGEYVVVVDGFAGAAGAFELEMDCDP